MNRWAESSKLTLLLLFNLKRTVGLKRGGKQKNCRQHNYYRHWNKQLWSAKKKRGEKAVSIVVVLFTNRRPRRKKCSSWYSAVNCAAANDAIPCRVSARAEITEVSPAPDNGRRISPAPPIAGQSRLPTFASAVSTLPATRAVPIGIRPLAISVSSSRVPSTSCVSRSAVAPIL